MSFPCSKARADGDPHLQHHLARGLIIFHGPGGLQPSLPSHPGADPAPGALLWQICRCGSLPATVCLVQDGIDLEAVAELAEFADDEELSL